jgi:DNA-binding response OmpR family regulator
MVEDNEMNRQIAEELLRCEGAEVLLAEDGVDALKQITAAWDGDRAALDAVLMDVELPHINGLVTEPIDPQQLFDNFNSWFDRTNGDEPADPAAPPGPS